MTPVEQMSEEAWETRLSELSAKFMRESLPNLKKQVSMRINFIYLRTYC